MTKHVGKISLPNSKRFLRKLQHNLSTGLTELDLCEDLVARCVDCLELRACDDAASPLSSAADWSATASGNTGSSTSPVCCPRIPTAGGTTVDANAGGLMLDAGSTGSEMTARGWYSADALAETGCTFYRAKKYIHILCSKQTIIYFKINSRLSSHQSLMLINWLSA